MSRAILSADSLRSLPSPVRRAVQRIEIDELCGQPGTLTVTPQSENSAHLGLVFEVPGVQDDWRLCVVPSFTPTFRWAPHLTPADGYVIDQHVFRAPALIVCDSATTLALIPELELVPEARDAEHDARVYLDQDASRNELTLGL